MKGIIFTEFLEMVESEFGFDVSDRIIAAANPPSGGAYTSVGTYDHSEMAALVTALSEETAVGVPELLGHFGEYLFQRFTVLYPKFFRGAENAFEFLQSVDSHIHVEVRKLYPNAELPRFDCERISESRLLMIYRSSRHLEDLAEGLIRGCLEHFGEECLIERSAEPPDAVRFVINKVEISAPI